MEAEDEGGGGGTDAGLVLLRLDEKSYDETGNLFYNRELDMNLENV
jgi:hypothetical protein